MNSDNIFDILTKKGMIVFDRLEDGMDIQCVSDLCSVTYYHCHKIINKMQDSELLIKEYQGRKVIITLTKKGKDIQKLIRAVLKGLERVS